MKKILLLSLLFLPFLASNAFAQSAKVKRKKPIEHVMDGTFKYLEFYDTAKQLLISRFDVQENNPYSDLGFMKIEHEYTKYEIPDNLPVDTAFYLSPGLPWRNPNDDDTLVVDRIPKFALKKTRYSWDDTIKYVVISYSLIISNAADQDIGYHSTIFVFSETGEVINRFEHIPFNVSCVSVNKPGSYLFIAGGFSGIEDGPVGEAQVVIFDLKTNQIVYHEKMDGIPLGFPVDSTKFLVLSVIEMPAGPPITIMNIIDVESKVVYERRFSYEEKQNMHIKNITYLALFNEFKTGKTRTEYFSNYKRVIYDGE